VDWAEWWGSRGARELSLLLWALWDPLGHAPVDEYEKHALPLAQLLREGEPAEEIAGALGRLRWELRTAQDPERDLQVARKLLEWYEWSFERRR
jgi:hypothetical protein